jgi:hypothetical protein
MRSVLPALLVGMLILGGCHQRFKKNLGSIGDVRPQVLVTTGPSVMLGGSSGDGLLAAAVNVTQAVRSVNAADRLAEAVDVDRVNSAFAESLVQSLAGGPPFGTTPSPEASVLQVEVVSYGLQAPAMGMQGTFNYDLHVSIFKSDGSKVYNAHQGCNVAFGDASSLSQALGTVNNVKQINEMTDEQIQEAFEGAAAGCGQQLVMKMRQHAG